MTDKEKLEKIKALADKMYSRMSYLTSDTRPIRQAMDEYHQFIINEYHKEEPVSEDLEEACEQLAENARKHKAETSSPFFSQTDYKQGVMDGANWQKEKMMTKAIDGTARPDDSEIWCNLASSNLKDGDEVKVIVIKED